jgi:hypothetical protein
MTGCGQITGPPGETPGSTAGKMPAATDTHLLQGPAQSAALPCLWLMGGCSINGVHLVTLKNIWRARAVGCLAWLLVTCGFAAQERTNHWSFQPVVRLRPPEVSREHEAAIRGDIDRFAFARLEKEATDPSPEADRRTLIRRVYFDLIGLAPTPEETEEFIATRDPAAYEKLVDRLLGSPRYGERWARHWLDVVRFAESHGFEMNQARPNAWPYRDYVIRAFNENKPYDRFIREQLAGDAVGVEEATGFLVGGPMDQVKSPDPVLTANQRADELHDIVSTVGSTFLGLTVGCARCHNHKFDPIPQTDYYAIKACFEGVQHGERPMKMRDATERARELAERTRELRQIEAQLDMLEPLAQTAGIGTNRLRAAVSARRNVERFAPVSARHIRFTINATTDIEPCIDELEVYAAGGNSTNVALAMHGTKATASSVYPNSDIHRLEHINDGRHGNSRSWISNERGKGWVQLEFPAAVKIDRIVWGRDVEQKYADRLATDYRIEAALEPGEWRLIASSLDRQPHRRDAPSSGDSSSNDDLAKRRKALEKQVRELAAVPSVYAGRFETPKATHRFHRGDPTQPREEVAPGTLSRIALPASEASLAGGERERRAALANWIASPAHPLTARVMVNRLWHYHFGRGLVETPSDFGLNGATPTHPELLDWLASEFVERGWDIKAMHRLIVASATYRQSSANRPEAKTVDADTRLLWRYPSRRLEAEAIRDAMLAVSGNLNLKMGGPGFDLFESNNNYVKVYNSRSDFGPEEWRRMVYQAKPRMQLESTFGGFDCPDAGQIAPRRTTSTTPLQALSLLNSAFVLQQAETFAQRVQRESPADGQVARAFVLAFGRDPRRDELAAATELVEKHGLAALCRSLLNASEFIYVY